MASGSARGASYRHTLLVGAFVLLTGALLLLVGSPAADAATKASASASKRPEISSIRPKKAELGDTLTITGTRFTKGEDKNRIYFRRGRKVVFVRADGLSSRTIKVRVPGRLVQIMGDRNGEIRTSTFNFRVKNSTYLSRRWTRRIRLSVAAPDPVDCDRDGLVNEIERQVGTEPCEPDSDGDTLSDFFEYESASAWNGGSYPYPRLYPGKRPIPNPTKADTDGDGTTDDVEDTDGDLLTAAAEQDLTAAAFRAPRCSGGDGLFLNDLTRARPYYNDGRADSDGDRMADGAGVRDKTFNYMGENLDCDGWVPAMNVMIIPAAEDEEDSDTSSEDEPDRFLTLRDPSLCPAGSTSSEYGGSCLFNLTAPGAAAFVQCRTSPPSRAELQNWAWLDNAAEVRQMGVYGDPVDPDQDGDLVPDGCDDTDHDGWPNALEVQMMRDQAARAASLTSKDDPDFELEGEWNPLDRCAPGPVLFGLSPSAQDCDGIEPRSPAGPLGGGADGDTAPATPAAPVPASR